MNTQEAMILAIINLSYQTGETVVVQGIGKVTTVWCASCKAKWFFPDYERPSGLEAIPQHEEGCPVACLEKARD